MSSSLPKSGHLSGLLFFVLHAVALALANDWGMLIFDRPRGVAFGITMYWLWVGLSLVASATVILLRVAEYRVAFVLTLVGQSLVAASLYPGFLYPDYLLLCAISLLMTVGYLGWHRLSYRPR